MKFKTFKTCIRAYVLTTYVRIHVLSCTFCYNDVHEYTWYLHSKMTYRARVYVYAYVYDVYVAPVLFLQMHNGSVIYTLCTCILMDIKIKEKKISQRHSSTAGHQHRRAQLLALSRVSILFIFFAFHIQDTRVKYGEWGWTSRALPIRTCTSHNSLVTSTET